MKSILIILLSIILFVLGIGLVFGVYGLIAWGLGNALIVILGLDATWTYLQGFLTGFVIWAIKQLIKLMIIGE